MPTGTLKRFFDEKGYGFIQPDDGSGDLFAPTRSFNGDKSCIREGDKVEYQPGIDEKTGRTKADNWSRCGGGGGYGGGGGGGYGGGYYGGGGGGGGRRTGTIKKFFEDKGFGFITPDDGGKDLFAHVRSMQGGDKSEVREGMKVTFEEEIEPNGKAKAGSWSYTGGGGGCGGGDRYSPYGGGGGFGNPGYGGYAPVAAYGGAPPMGYGGQPGLPPGWEQIMDPGTGKPYFCNRSTGESSWSLPMGAPPPAAMPPANPGLPHGWESTMDPGSGKTYYFNRATGQSSWTPP